jgi:hypothetical protein
MDAGGRATQGAVAETRRKNQVKTLCLGKFSRALASYTYRISKFGAFAPSPAGEGWGEEILKTEF